MNKVREYFLIFALVTLFATMADRLLFVLFPIYLINRDFSATEIGIIFSFAAMILVLSRTFIGKLSDRYGRKTIMSLGLLMDSIAISLYPAISRLGEFALVKGVKEIGITLQASIGDTLYADSFPRKIRAKYLTKLGTLFPLSRIAAAITGFFIATYLSVAFGFYAAAFFMLVSFAIFSLFYKDNSKKDEFPDKLKPAEIFPEIQYHSIFRLHGGDSIQHRLFPGVLHIVGKGPGNPCR